jgi:hypothetical protein
MTINEWQTALMIIDGLKETVTIGEATVVGKLIEATHWIIQFTVNTDVVLD